MICPNNLTGDPIPNPWYSPTKFECRKINGYYSNRCSQVNWASVPYNYDSSNSPYSSYQETKTGDGYAIIPTYKGWLYIQNRLKQPLQVNKKYWCNYWVSTVNISKYASNNLSMLLTNSPVFADTLGLNNCNGLLAASPQIVNYGNPIICDTLNWVPISGIYSAIGGEQYVTLGNFKPDSLTKSVLINNTIYAFDAAGYYVDDVSVIPLDSFNLKADAGRDTTITIGDSAFIGSYTNGIDTLRWQILGTSNTIDSLRPGFWVKPLVNTCYILTQTVNGFTSSDTVCINVNPLPLTITNYELRIINEQSLQGTKQSIINLWQTANEINVSHFNVQRSINGIQFENIGQIKAHNNNLNEYEFIDNNLPLTVDSRPLTLYYRIESIDKDGKKQYSEVKNLELGIRNSRIVVYPNPAKDMINIQSTEGVKEIQLFDMFGREISLPKIRNQNNGNNIQLALNIQQYSKGVYILKVITNKSNVVSEKLIIQ